MKNKSLKNLIFGFLSKVKIKKFLLVIYCVVPILVFSVGFAAWRITGNETFGASGSFLSYPIINSYDYVYVDGTQGLALDGSALYPTRFYDDEGNAKEVAKIDVVARINLSKCKKLLEERSSGNTIYTEFSFAFSNGTIMEAFFKNLTLEVKASSDKNDFNGSSANVQTTEKSSTTASYTVQLSIDLSKVNASTGTGEETEGTSDGNEYVYLKLTYTLDPKASDYQTLYNKLVDNNLQFMIDVKISDIPPTTNN